MFWKVYFVVMGVLTVVGIATQSTVGIEAVLDVVLTIPGLIGLYGYAFKKRFLSAKIWKIYLPIFIVGNVLTALMIKPEESGQSPEAMALYGFIFLIPWYIALYLYGFKFFNAQPADATEEDFDADDSTQQPLIVHPSRSGKWLYGIAILLFAAGGADFALFVSQQRDGLSNPMSLVGLVVWWGLAGTIAALAYFWSRQGRTQAVPASAGAQRSGVSPQPTPAARQAPQADGISRRRPDGRERPYRALRLLAKLYIILAPLVLIIMLLVGLGTMMSDAPLSAKLGVFFGVLIQGSIYYLLMQSIAQAIYLLFDIASNSKRAGEATEMRQTQATA